MTEKRQKNEHINKIKEVGEVLRQLMGELHSTTKEIDMGLTVMAYNHRWLSIGGTDLQKGIMALNRALEESDCF